MSTCRLTAYSSFNDKSISVGDIIVISTVQLRLVELGSLRLAVTLVLLLGGGGCQKRPVENIKGKSETLRGLEVKETSQALLVSEILSARDQQNTLKCPVTIKNTSNEKSIVTLTAVGCSCYRIELNQQPLVTGTEIPVAPGAEVTLEFRAVVPATQLTKDYSADFTVTSGHSEQTIRATCTLNIFSDVSLSPNVVTAEADYETGGVKTQKLTIFRVLREADIAMVGDVPVLEHLPESVNVTSIEQLGDPETLEDGLTRVAWVANLEVTVPKEAAADAPPISYVVQFPGVDRQAPSEKMATQGQLIIRSRAPIAFPKTIHFGKFPLGETRNRRFLVVSPEENNFKLLPVGQLPESIKVDAKPELAARHWLDVKIQPTETGDFDETLSFETGLQEMPTIKIQLKALIE